MNIARIIDVLNPFFAPGITEVCGECGDFGPCTEPCGANGSMTGTQRCHKVSGATGRMIQGTMKTQSCTDACFKECPTTTTEATKTTEAMTKTIKGKYYDYEILQMCIDNQVGINVTQVSSSYTPNSPILS